VLCLKRRSKVIFWKKNNAHKYCSSILLYDFILGDWATVGVVYYKTTQTSKNGNTYTLLKITDLQGDIETW
jgi:hypothetical protein